MGNYTLIDTGDKTAGGGITAPMMPGQPTAWMPYAAVDSVKKSVAKAEKNGAKILVAYQPIPGNGAIGVFVDPTGAAFGMWEQEKKKPAAKKAKKARKK
jgi:predicted enzyme related to lactoylglutathione lyase